jgi:hypothetical protein
MKSKRVWRYYCDFCRKSGCNGGHIRKHEASCCSNPDRVCRMCRWVDAEQKPTAELRAAFESGGLDSLRKAADGCPACILAGIIAWQKAQREAGVQDGEGELWVDFDFTAETKAMWEHHNTVAASAEYEFSGGQF